MAQRRVDPRLGDPAIGTWRLLFDGAQLWAVGSGTGATSDAVRVRRIDPVTLKPGPAGPASASPGGLPVTDAAVLDGHVYLKAPSGIFVVVAQGDSAPSVDFAGLAGGTSIAADPRRHRLLTVSHDSGEQYTVAAVTPPPSTTPRSAEDSPPPSSTPENSLYQAIVGLAVVGDGPIWASIGPVHGPATAPTLIRLDPTTLKLWPPSRGVAGAEHRVTLIGGASRLWLRGTGNDHQLWCLDADNGQVLQHWSRLDGTMTPAPDGGMYLAQGNSLGRLKLNGACTPAQS